MMDCFDANYFDPPHAPSIPEPDVIVGESGLDPNHTPSFFKHFAQALNGKVTGYAYYATHDPDHTGYILPRDDRSKKARAFQDGGLDFDAYTRTNVASVSKSVAAIAVLKALRYEQDKNALNQSFFPVIASKLPGVNNGVEYFKDVTIQNLLTMHVSVSAPILLSCYDESSCSD